MADLITLEEFKEIQGINSDDQDLQYDKLLGSVSQLVRTYCGRDFLAYYDTDKTEKFNIFDNTSYVYLTEFPIVEIVSVKERATYGSSYNTLTTSDYEYYLDTSTHAVVRSTPGGLKYFCQGPEAVEVVYKGGYQTTPEDLKLAIADLIVYYQKDEYKVQRIIGNATLTGAGVSHLENFIGFPDHITRVLEQYRVAV